MDTILFWSGLSLAIISFGFLIYFLTKFIKDRAAISFTKKVFLQLLIPIVSLFVSTPMIFMGCALMNHWILTVMEIMLIITGGAFFGASFGLIFCAFILRYYKDNIASDKHKKIISYLLFGSIPLLVISFLVFMEGMAAHFTYPLTNGLRVSSDGVMWTTYKDGHEGFNITFYGAIIVMGAIIVYFICDHKFYVKYHKHGLLDTCFLIAFPMGIVGARLWSCLVLYPDHYLVNPIEILYVWDGGLAIMGGAILGIVTGVTYMLIFRKYINLRLAVDMIVPCILIAQAIGRWANFFNHEIYGNITDMSSWCFLPSFIRNQMSTGFINGSPSSTTMYVPLFLIESCTNLIGYFVIAYAIGKPLKKYLALGDLGCAYFIWYGTTRAIMEPMRYGDSGQVDKFIESWYSSFALIAIGIIGIIAFHLYEHWMRKNGKAIKGV